MVSFAQDTQEEDKQKALALGRGKKRTKQSGEGILGTRKNCQRRHEGGNSWAKMVRHTCIHIYAPIFCYVYFVYCYRYVNLQ